MDQVKVYSYLNYEAIEAQKAKNITKTPSGEASQTDASSLSVAPQSKVSFDETYALAKRAMTALNVDSALLGIKKVGESGIPIDSQLAKDLGIAREYLTSVRKNQLNLSNVTTAKVQSSVNNGRAPIMKVDTSSLPVDVSGHTTTKCPSHDGSSGYVNSGELECSDELQQYFEEAAAATGVDVKLLKAVAYRESSFNPNDLSSAGAMGIMQLMPCNVSDYNIKDPYNARENILGGACELADYLNKYNGDLRLSLAAYNAGTGTVKKYGGVPEFCNRYIDKIITLYNS